MDEGFNITCVDKKLTIYKEISIHKIRSLPNIV